METLEYIPPEALRKKIAASMPEANPNDPKAVARREKLIKETAGAYGFGGPKEYKGPDYKGIKKFGKAMEILEKESDLDQDGQPLVEQKEGVKLPTRFPEEYRQRYKRAA